MTISAETTVREIAVEQPASIRVFERFGIDYCCGGRKSLQQACREQQLSCEQVLEKLKEATAVPVEKDETQWATLPLARVIQQIVRKHHVFTRQELPRLRVLAQKVESRHHEAHPELAAVRDIVCRLE